MLSVAESHSRSFVGMGVAGGSGVGSFGVLGSSLTIEPHRIEANEHAVGGMKGLGPKGGQSKACICKKGRHIAWDAKYKFHVPLGSDEIPENLFVKQKITFDNIADGRHRKVFKIEMVEVFKVGSDGWTDEDPHWVHVGYPEFCVLFTEESGELSLVTIDPSPEADNTPPDSFMKFSRKDTETHRDGSTETHDHANMRPEDRDHLWDDEAYIITPVSNASGAYSAKYHPDHCRRFVDATQEPVDPPPPDTGGGTPTPPDGGEPTTHGPSTRGTPTEPSTRSPGKVDA
jgi:hypothetical protein